MKTTKPLTDLVVPRLPLPLGMVLPVLLCLLLGTPFVTRLFAQEKRGPKTLENLLDASAEVTPHGTLSRPPGGSGEPEIDEAWRRYEKSVRAASAGLLKRLAPGGTKADRAPSKPPSPTDAAAGREAARKGFVEQGRLPSILDTGLRSVRQETEKAYADAAAALRMQYDRVAAGLRQQGHADEAAAITDEWTLLQHVLDLTAEPQLDSTWKHSIENGPSAEIALYSNGTINAPDGPDTWTLKGTTLVIRWKNPEAPGGEWIDTCEVAPHGGSYAGRNQLGTRISGTRVP